MAPPRARSVLHVAAAVTVVAGLAHPARAQFAAIENPGAHPVSPATPVTFSADRVTYDRAHDLVIASGNVQAWQNGHILAADKVIFDRRTGVVAAAGHVMLLDPGGQVVFANYAELDKGMRDGVLKAMRARLANNGKLAANGARRVGGKINELSRVVYSACDLCKKNPLAPPLWQIRAASAVQDLQHKRIEYTDATLEMAGIPVAWFPFLSQPDPSVKRASGLLIPSLGESTHLGAFLTIPYFWAIDPQSDLTVVPILTTKQPPGVTLDYRRAFNFGALSLKGDLGYDNNSFQSAIFAQGRFSIDRTWRAGFDFNRASSATYLRDYRIQPNTDVLTSDAFLEGFGPGAYALLDTRLYQGLVSSITDSRLPFVLPRFTYSFFGQRDGWDGRTRVTVGAFNVIRTDGSKDARGALTLDWQRPFTGYYGDLWKLDFHLDAAAYEGTDLNQQPNFYPVAATSTARALPQVALDFRWPWLRSGGGWGSQLIEPIAQIIVAPNIGNQPALGIPNEDSLALQFTDANLFGFNRFPGIDRLEGGIRANVALHAAWYLHGRTIFDGLVGQSYRTAKDTSFPVGSGLSGTVSDIVARASLSPTPWLDLTYRTRLSHKDLRARFIDALASVGEPVFRVSTGYLYTATNPYFLYDQASVPASYNQPRQEILLALSSALGDWRFSGYARRNLASGSMDGEGVDVAFENNCFILDVRFDRRETSLNGDHGATSLLFNITFKTVGQVGFNAL